MIGNRSAQLTYRSGPFRRGPGGDSASFLTRQTSKTPARRQDAIEVLGVGPQKAKREFSCAYRRRCAAPAGQVPSGGSTQVSAGERLPGDPESAAAFAGA